MPDETLFCFSAGLIRDDLFDSHVYECRWNYTIQNWEVVRLRKKDMNHWDTVVATLQNIVEDIQVEELARIN